MIKIKNILTDNRQASEIIGVILIIAIGIAIICTVYLYVSTYIDNTFSEKIILKGIIKLDNNVVLIIYTTLNNDKYDIRQYYIFDENIYLSLSNLTNKYIYISGLKAMTYDNLVYPEITFVLDFENLKLYDMYK